MDMEVNDGTWNNSLTQSRDLWRRVWPDTLLALTPQWYSSAWRLAEGHVIETDHTCKLSLALATGLTRDAPMLQVNFSPRSGSHSTPPLLGHHKRCVCERTNVITMHNFLPLSCFLSWLWHIILGGRSRNGAGGTHPPAPILSSSLCSLLPDFWSLCNGWTRPLLVAIVFCSAKLAGLMALTL